MQIKKWYGEFASIVRTFDAKLNDYTRSEQISSCLTARNKSQSAPPAVAPRATARFRPAVTVTEDESDSEFISDTENPETVERNCTTPLSTLLTISGTLQYPVTIARRRGTTQSREWR